MYVFYKANVTVIYGRKCTSFFEGIGQVVHHILHIDLFYGLILESKKKNRRLLECKPKYTNTIE